MATKWIKWIKTAHKGLRYYEHLTRKHGKRKDRYYSVRIKVDGKDYTYGIGWWSDGVPEEARKIDPDIGFEEYCLSRMKLFKLNIKTGSGPKSPKEVRKVTAEKESQDRALQEIQDKESIIFGDYFKDTYLPETSNKKSADVEKYIYDKWIYPIIGKIRIYDITDSHLKKIKKNMEDAGKAVRTVHYAFAIVSQVWNRARKEKIVQSDCPTRDVDLPKIDNQKKRALTKQEADALLNYLKGKSHQLYELSYLSLYTGARFIELAGLTWRQVNTDEGSILFRNTKSGNDRTVFMTKGVKQLFKAMDRGLPDSLIFTDKKGHRLLSVSNTFDRAVSDLKLNAGVVDPRDRISFHGLRHTHASWLVNNGTNLFLVKEILGHSDFKMTVRYSHPAADNLKQAMKGLEKYVGPGKKKKASQGKKRRK